MKTQNESLHKKAREKFQNEKEISLLLEATKSVLENKSFNNAVMKIFESCKIATGASSGYIALISDDRKENEVLFLDAGGLPCSVNPEFPMPIRGLREEAYRFGKVVYENDFTNTDWVKFLPDGHVGLNNVLFSPLIFESKVEGILGLANKEDGFNEEDVHITRAFGEIAAIALKNSKNEEALRNSEQRFKNLNVELEHKVIERTAQLETAIKELESFSYSVSHDLRGPLTRMDGFSKALTDYFKGKIDETGQHYINRIRSSCQHMSQLINDLLSLSIISQKDLINSKVNISGLAEKIFQENTEPEGTRIIRYEIEPNLISFGDEGLIHILLENLIGNAVKFSANKNPAIIRLGKIKKDLKSIYFISDNGQGFDMAYADKLFKPFQRLHSAREYSGTGIGLATVHRIVKRHRGKIWADSKRGEGCTFYFTLE